MPSIRTAGRALFGLFVLTWSLGPIYWAVNVSLTTPVGLQAVPLHLTPDPFTLAHYTRLLDPANSGANSFYLALGNSVIEAGVATACIVFVSLLGGYAFARWKFVGSRSMFLVIMATLSIPLLAVLIPLYRWTAELGLLDSYPPIILLAIVANLPLGLWIVRSFVASLPQEIEAAARLDGANEPRILWSIILPLLGPAVVAVAIITFLTAWSAFLVPLFFSQSPATRPLTIFIANLATKEVRDLGLEAAAACLSMAAPIVLVVALHRYLTSGLLRGAFK
jgi:multiple sugar transport system permease protein